MKDKKTFLIIRKFEIEAEDEDKAWEEFYLTHGSGSLYQQEEEIYEKTGR